MPSTTTTTTTQDLTQKSLQLKQDNKFYSRLLSKETSPSFRVYYSVNVPGSVPFHWESRPGTPKNALPINTIPPLTPPPSYHYSSKSDSPSHGVDYGTITKWAIKLSSKVRRLFVVMLPKKRMPGTPRAFSSKPYLYYFFDEDEELENGKQKPTVCFNSVGLRRRLRLSI